jgi:hypothetical protein
MVLAILLFAEYYIKILALFCLNVKNYVKKGEIFGRFGAKKGWLSRPCRLPSLQNVVCQCF